MVCFIYSGGQDYILVRGYIILCDIDMGTCEHTCMP